MFVCGGVWGGCVSLRVVFDVVVLLLDVIVVLVVVIVVLLLLVFVVLRCRFMLFDHMLNWLSW